MGADAPLRVAVVGMGAMGNQHARVWQKMDDATLAAVVAPEAIATGAGNLNVSQAPLQLGTVPVLPSADVVIEDTTIDIVDLCIPTYLHADLAVRALESGKHVLVEKPMALSGADCDRMMAAARQAGKLLMVGHVIRFWSEYLPLFEAMQTGALGKLHSLELRRQAATPTWSPWFTDPAKSGGGVFDLLIHDVDVCVGLLGTPQAISATGYGDYLAAKLHYPKVASVSISGGWHACAAYPFAMGYEARFDAGTVEFSSELKTVRLYGVDGQVTRPVLARTDAYEAELAYFAACVRQNKPAARCPMEQSAMSVRLIGALAEARAERGRVMEWTPA